MQLPDGRFADASGLAVLDTSEALLALAAVSPASAAIGNGRFALLLARPGSLDLEARRLGAICGDRGLAFGLSLGEDALAADGGLGDAPGAGVASVYATASFIEQLTRCGGDDLSRLSRAAHALQLLQHPDGGFGLSGDDSRVEVTAIATLALAPVAALLGAEPSVAAGATFLLAAQLPSGAFGSGSANDTALSLLALAAAGSDRSRIETGVIALEEMQAPDGSFGSVRTTALAARALGASRPDLRIEAGGITEAAPLVPGELGTVQVRVVNAGASAARVRVGLFAGDPLAGAPRLGTSTPVDVPVGGYPVPVAATVAITDLHPTVTHTLLDGVAYASGTPIASEGPHVLTIHAEDGAGNSADRTVAFALDLTAPVITIAGVQDGGIYTGTVVATLSASDASPVSITATLDGAPYTSGTGISGNGPHLLEATAIDAAGNEATVFAAFELRHAVPDFRFGLCSTRDTKLENSASGVSSGGLATLISTAGTLSMSNSSRIEGDAVVGGDLSMSNTARITGTASIVGTAAFANSSGVGALVYLPAPPELCTCGFDLADAMADAAASNDNALLAGVVALTNGTLELTHQEAVLLPTGRYYVTGLTLLNQASVGPAPGAAVELYVDGAVSVRNGSVLGDPGGDPTRFLLVSTAGPPTGTEVVIENSTGVGLRLYAPDADVTIENNSDFVGGIVGGTVLLQNSGQLISTHSSSSADALVCP